MAATCAACRWRSRTRIGQSWNRRASRVTRQPLRCALVCCPARRSCASARPDSPRRKSRCTRRPTISDTIGDGTPDFLRLHDPADRAGLPPLVHAAGGIAVSTARKPLPEIDDCAALLRFAYREALREHDAAWAHAMALPAPASAGDIQQYQYPYTPLGAALFRVRGGSFAAGDLERRRFRAVCRRGDALAAQHVFRRTET